MAPDGARAACRHNEGSEIVAQWGLSNSRECLSSLRDKRVVGFLEDALPINRADLARGTTTLVFEDGTGFTFTDQGSFWHENAEDVARALDRLRKHLEQTRATIESLLAMAGKK